MKTNLLKQTLITILILGTFSAKAGQFDDLNGTRVFEKVPEATLEKMFTPADKGGFRKVRDFKLVKSHLQSLQKKFKGSEDTLFSITAKSKFFVLDNRQDAYNNDGKGVDKSVHLLSAHVQYIEPDDRNPPASNFLHVGGTWYLMPANSCASNRIGTTIVNADFGSSKVLFISQMRWSGGFQTTAVCSVTFEFSSQNSKAVPTKVKAWQEPEDDVDTTSVGPGVGG